MNKLLLKAASVLLLAFLTYALMVYAVFFRMPYMDSGDYISAILDKDRLLRDTPSPKIVFVGASNLAFGLDSERVQSAMRLPVVNLGLHGGVGLKYMLDSTRPYVKKGDIVVEGKMTLDAFHSTALDYLLRANQIEYVAFTGFHTNWCVESSARSAYDKGYRVHVISDCTATDTAEEQNYAEKWIFPKIGKVMTSREFLASLV